MKNNKFNWDTFIKRSLLAAIILMGITSTWFLGAWILDGFHPEPILLAISIVSTACAGFLAWFREKNRVEVKTPIDQIIKMYLPYQLLNWNEKARQLSLTIEKHAQEHKSSDFIIHLVGLFAELISPIPFVGHAGSHYFAFKEKSKIYRKMIKDIEAIFSPTVKKTEQHDTTSSANHEEFVDIFIEDVVVEIASLGIAEVLGGAVGKAILLLSPIFAKQGLAEIYTWSMGTTATIYILNQYNHLNDDKKNTIEATHKLLRTQNIDLNFFKIPKKIEKPDWDDLLKIKDLSLDLHEKMKNSLKAVRVEYPEIKLEELRQFYINLGLPNFLVEATFNNKTWNESIPYTPTFREKAKEWFLELIH